MAAATMRWPTESPRATRRRAPSRQKAAVQPKAATTYEAAAATRRTLNWTAPTTSPNTAILYNLTTLRDRSRAAVRNDGVAKSIIDKLVSNIVGTGIKPLSKSSDPAFREAVQNLWARWTDESDADGLLDFYGQQSQATRAWLEGGDCYVRIRLRRPEDGLSVPLQIQLLEPEFCPHTYNTTLPNGNKVRAGIEFSPIGKRLAYWMYRSRPGDIQEMDTTALVRVPASSVAPLYDPLRPGQLRGVPRLTQALIRLYDLDKFSDASVYRQQLANMFLGFIKRQPATGDENVHPLTGAPVTGTAVPTLTFEPGLLQELNPGEEMQFSDPPDPSATYEAFMRANLAIACVSAGVPYEVVTGDLRGLNDRTMRLIVNEFRRQIEASQHQILAFQFCRPIWRAWMDQVFFSSALPLPASYAIDASPWLAVKWMPPKWAYIHPVQDVQAQKDAIRDGFTSRAAVVSENGEDAESIDREQAADNARADGLGLRYDSDGRQRVTQATAAGPDPLAEDDAPAAPAQNGAPA